MNARDLLLKQFQLMYDTTAMTLDGVSARDSLVQPSGGGNCANWVLGHMTAVQNFAMDLAGAKAVWDHPQLERAGADPITEPADALDWDEMVARFLGSRDRLAAALDVLSDEELDELLDDPFGGSSPRIELLAVIAFHQAYHAGQLALGRRLAGLDGAVRGPGQTDKG